MSKIGITKRLIALVLSATTIGGVTIALSELGNEKKTTKIQNKSGYTNIQPINILNWNVKEENFVILDIGDHDTVKTSFQDKKMKLCSDKDISLGVIISTDATNEAEIYDDVEYAKGIVRDYKVDFPVYLNIDDIITNEKLNPELKTKLIKDFLEKCSANNMYVGLCGTDTNLCRVRDYCDVGISNYDCFVIMDKEEIEYDGRFVVYKDLKGKLHSKENLSEVINNKGLNNSKGFADDGSYTMSKNDQLLDVALRYGMSEAEILDFNGMKKSDVKEGTVLRIPSVIDKSVPKGDFSFEKLDEPIRGVDISYAQESDIDWDFMTENYEFMILKCSYGAETDEYFEINAQQANMNGLPIGVYCYNEYTNGNCNSLEEFKKKQELQAEHAISLLKNKRIDYPVYLDIEKGSPEAFPAEWIQEMLEIWNNKVSEAGYSPGIYCNQNWFRNLQEDVDYKISDKFEVWIAGGDQYSTTEDDCTQHKHLTLDEIKPSDVLDNKDYGARMAQSTNIGYNAGAGDSRGHLDIDYSYVDYSQKGSASSEEKTTFGIKEFNRIDYDLLAAGAIGSVGIGAAAGVILARRKNNKAKTGKR